MANATPGRWMQWRVKLVSKPKADNGGGFVRRPLVEEEPGPDGIRHGLVADPAPRSRPAPTTRKNAGGPPKSGSWTASNRASEKKRGRRKPASSVPLTSCKSSCSAACACTSPPPLVGRAEFLSRVLNPHRRLRNARVCSVSVELNSTTVPVLRFRSGLNRLHKPDS